MHTVEHYRKFEEMIQDAVSACEVNLAPEIVTGLKSGLLDKARKMRAYYAGLLQRQKAMDRWLFQLSQLFTGPAEAAFRNDRPVVRQTEMALYCPG